MFTNIKIDRTFISRNRRKSYTLSFQGTYKKREREREGYPIVIIDSQSWYLHVSIQQDLSESELYFFSISIIKLKHKIITHQMHLYSFFSSVYSQFEFYRQFKKRRYIYF